MPIKLLHHKSWHVYSRDNIARVQRDEAAERARLDTIETAQKSATSQARLDTLRGIQSTDSPQSLADFSVDADGRIVKKRKREDEMKVLDRRLDGKSKDQDLPVSQYVVHTDPNVKSDKHDKRDKDNDTFSALDKATWYAQSTEVTELSRKKEVRKESLDPLNDVQAFLARKKAMRREKERREQDRGETYGPDRYNPAPENKRSKSRNYDEGARHARSHRREGRARHRSSRDGG